MSTITTETRKGESSADWLEIVRNNVGALRFGSVQITVHDGRVTQIESIEKTRFVADRADSPAPRK